MTKSSISKFFKTIGRSVSKRSPEILTGIGIAGMVTTAVLAVKATPKALELIEDAKRQHYIEEKGSIDADPKFLDYKKPLPSKLEYVKVAWKPYIPAAITGVASVCCLVGASSVNARRNAALATAYKLSETALAEFKDKAVEVVGEEKVNEIKKSVAKDRVDKAPVSKNEVFITKKGDTLCYDSISGRYFKSDIETIKQAVNELNRQMIGDMYISLTEFYDAIGLHPTSLSDDLGWNLEEGFIEIDFGSQIADDGTPCIVLEYHIAPRYDYSKLM